MNDREDDGGRGMKLQSEGSTRAESLYTSRMWDCWRRFGRHVLDICQLSSKKEAKQNGRHIIDES